MQARALHLLGRSRAALHVLALVWGMLLVWWDPLGLSSAGERALADFYHSSLAGVYPDEKRPRTAVVLTTDADLETLGITWPVSPRYHDGFLYAIGRAAPKSVFVDLFFIDNRIPADAKRLQARLHWLACQTQLYLMAPPPEARSGLSNDWTQFYLNTSATDSDCPIRLVNSSSPTVGHTYAYPSPAQDAGLRSPAEQVYVDSGLGEERQSSPWHDERVWEITWSLPSRRNCDEIAASHLLAENSLDVCEELERSAIVRVVRHIANAVSGNRFPHLQNDVSIQDVSPVPVFGVAELSKRGGPAFSALQNAHVVYAVNVVGAEDTVISPVYRAVHTREIPAGFAHAVAIDNLIAYEGKPKGYLKSSALKYLFGACAFLFGSVVFSALCLVVGWRRRIIALSLLVSGVLAISVCVVYGELFRLAAIEWVSIPFAYFAAMSSLAPMFREPDGST